MTIVWLLFWLAYNTPKVKGDDLFGLSKWGVALVACAIVDVAR